MKKLPLLSLPLAFMALVGCQAAPAPVATAAAGNSSAIQATTQRVSTPRIVELPNLKNYIQQHRHLLQTGYGTDPIHQWSMAIGGNHTVSGATHNVTLTYNPSGDAATGTSSSTLPANPALWSNYQIHLYMVVANFQTPSEYNIVYQVPAGRILVCQVNCTAAYDYGAYVSLYDYYVGNYLRGGAYINRMPIAGFNPMSGGTTWTGATTSSPTSSSSRYLIYGPGDVLQVKLLDPRIASSGTSYSPWYYLFYLNGVSNYSSPFFPLFDVSGYTVTPEFLAAMKPVVGVK